MAGLELAMYQSALEFVGLLQPCLMDAGIPVMTASFPLLISLLCLIYIHGESLYSV